MIKTNKIIRLVFSIAICQLAGIIGSIFTVSSIPDWYASLQKPSFGPPNWVFAPVWTTLFFLMGIALYLVWNSGMKKKQVRSAVIIFGFQLLLNVVWSVMFFGLHNPFYAFIEIILLWVVIMVMIIKFYRIDKNAALLLVPYILWVSFAVVLNFYIWLLNV